MMGDMSARIVAWAVPLNFAWEMGQSPAYTGIPASRWSMVQECGVHSLIDGLIVLSIFWGGVLLFRRRDWLHRPGLAGYFWMETAGFLVSVVIELNAVYRLGTWGYGEAMPLIPGVGVGLLPVLQMLVLPPAIFSLASKGILHAGRCH